MGAKASRCLELAPAEDETSGPKNPGPFERLHDDCRRVVHCNTFEGVKFDVSKPLTPTFAVNHNFWLGGSHYPSANQHYKFGATLGDNERVCFGSVDQYGTVEGQIVGAVAGPLQGKLIFNLPNDPQAFVGICDLDYIGTTSSSQLKVARNIHGVNGTHLGCSYVQAITKRLALGGEGILQAAAPAATFTSALKWTGDKWSGVASWSAGPPAQPGQLALGYARTVSPNRVTLGTELNVAPATGDASFSAGAEFALKQSRVNLAVDGSGRMQSCVEAVLSPAAKLLFSAEMTLGWAAEPGKPRDSFKFGYGLQIGS